MDPRPRQFLPLSLNEATLTGYREAGAGVPGAVLFLGAPVGTFRLEMEAQEVLWAASGDTTQAAHHVGGNYLLTCERTGVLHTADGKPALLVLNETMVFDVAWHVAGPGTTVWHYGLRFGGVTGRSNNWASQGFHAFDQSQQFRARTAREMTPAELAAY